MFCMLMLFKPSYGTFVSPVILHLPHRDTDFPWREAAVVQPDQILPSHGEKYTASREKKKGLNIFGFSSFAIS